jgi:hypothetical protein
VGGVGVHDGLNHSKGSHEALHFPCDGVADAEDTLEGIGGFPQDAAGTVGSERGVIGCTDGSR